MAYQTRQRDPLLDTTLQITLARRGREGLGVVMALAGIVLALMLWTSHPEDPNWLAATDATPQNWFGLLGASVAATLYFGLGYGAYALAAGLIVWGVRFACHWGAERALPRALFVAGWALVVSLFCTSMTPIPGWSYDFGMGGLFGETLTGALLTILPIHAAVGLKLFTLMLSAAVVGVGAWVLGFTREDLGRAVVFLLNGFGSAWYLLRILTGAAARGAATQTVRTAGSLRDRRAARAAEADPAPDPAPRRGLSSWLPRRAPAPKGEIDAGEPETDDDRVRARIASAVRSRVRHAAPETAEDATPARAEPVLTALSAAAERRVEPVLHAPDAPSSFVPPVPEEPALTAPRARPEGEEDALFEAPDPVPAPKATRAPISRKVVQPAAKPPAPSRQAKAEAQPGLPFDGPSDDYEMPPLSLLADPATVERHVLSDEALEENARMLETVLDDYGVKGEITQVRPGPVVTMYELEPAPGLKASRVIGLADDIARSMSALSARVSTVPGRSVIGIELPNERREKVVLREILSARDYGDSTQALPLALGKDIGGAPIVANLAKMPHLLIAGTTGSGKSVAINTMILSLLYKLRPEECRMIMIDPKMLELSVYDGIPHLLSPVVTDPKKAVVALKWVVGEMEERYRKMSRMGVRNIDGYNGRVADLLAKGEMITRTIQTGFDEETGDPVFETEEETPEKMPYIVVIVDEMADLMMVAGKEIEACIQRLAQMARASGIHLVMATQRPSVDVITGTIKANFPTRISFHVTSKIDSRTILGEMGAEQLLGMGDMLYMAGGSKITRIHGPFCSDEEVEEIVNHLKSFGPPDYAASVLDGPDEDKSSDIDAVLGLGGNTGSEDALYDQAVAIVAKDRKCSTSYIQRKLGIGYNKAARLVEQMEDNGVVGASNQVGKREILVPEIGG
ncbi:DNA translocase FtsK [Jannaschia seohaensis]|uniref:DNA translocase FtsK n=1 Tax=Jannaschia seohaensis TaxID=475081 RepID=A0A2Y9A515_9RHOB|nr:DNA translocase FtsK [Jannaschia seohaensis]PWJ22270.1 S-DNA-T family DNA segregation ATPase FtsK/SpoIIIE [Jannaschia seohaensis]SSA38548.1 DNA segregation ATPase FtsK/SpoIIIE, S-DNA-T family [Jannaschia seohaensis]